MNMPSSAWSSAKAWAQGLVSGRALTMSTTGTGTASQPDPRLFQSGDFVWPKPPDAYVPYSVGEPEPETAAEDERRWAEHRAYYMARMQGQTEDPGLMQRLELLEKMSFQEFRAIFLGGHDHTQMERFGLNDIVYIGHVGILWLDDQGKPWVVEAIMNPTYNVRKIPYGQWPHLARGDYIWLGRLKGHGAAERAKIAAAALTQLDKPYNLFDFNLNDDSQFYCSKLAWFSVYRGLNGYSVDGKGPDRLLWFSPKQMLDLDLIDVINRPHGEVY